MKKLKPFLASYLENGIRYKHQLEASGKDDAELKVKKLKLQTTKRISIVEIVKQ